MAIPRRVYTQSHIDHVIDSIVNVWRRREGDYEASSWFTRLPRCDISPRASGGPGKARARSSCMPSPGKTQESREHARWATLQWVKDYIRGCRLTTSCLGKTRFRIRQRSLASKAKAVQPQQERREQGDSRSRRRLPSENHRLLGVRPRTGAVLHRVSFRKPVYQPLPEKTRFLATGYPSKRPALRAR